MPPLENGAMSSSAGAMTTPTTPGDAPLPKRNGPKGMLPSTWLQRELKVEYLDAGDNPTTTSAVLLDWFPFGSCLNIGGAQVLVSWDRLVVVELVED